MLYLFSIVFDVMCIMNLGRVTGYYICMNLMNSNLLHLTASSCFKSVHIQIQISLFTIRSSVSSIPILCSACSTIKLIESTIIQKRQIYRILIFAEAKQFFFYILPPKFSAIKRKMFDDLYKFMNKLFVWRLRNNISNIVWSSRYWWKLVHSQIIT